VTNAFSPVNLPSYKTVDNEKTTDKKPRATSAGVAKRRARAHHNTASQSIEGLSCTIQFPLVRDSKRNHKQLGLLSGKASGMVPLTFGDQASVNMDSVGTGFNAMINQMPSKSMQKQLPMKADLEKIRSRLGRFVNSMAGKKSMNSKNVMRVKGKALSSFLGHIHTDLARLSVEAFPE
jgi:hypothetical protein